MKINWLVRAKNKTFWLALVPALFLVVTQVLQIFGVRLDLSNLEGQIASVIEAVFALLAVLGIVNDPTTEGVSDSERALAYVAPAENATDEADETSETISDEEAKKLFDAIK